MNKIYRYFLLCFFTTSTLFSQQVINWEQVLKEAKEKNPQLRQAELNLTQTELKIALVKSELYPQISFSLSSEKNYSENFESKVNYSYNIYAGVTLFSGFSTINSLKSQLLDLQIAEENYKRVLSDIVFSLKESFINLYYTQEMYFLAENIFKRRKQNYELIKLKYESGSEDLGSFLRVEADMLQAEYELRKIKRERENAIRELLKNIGRDDFIDIKVETYSDLSSDIEKIIAQDGATIIAQIPEYKIKQYQLAKMQIQAKIAKSSFYPSLSFSANYGLSDTNPIPDKNKWSLSLGLRASYNIFSGFRDLIDLKIANNNIKTAEFELHNTKLNLINNFYILKNNLIDIKESLIVKEKYLKALEKQAEIVSIKYANGLASYYDWYQTEDSFINTQKSLLDLKKELILSELNLKKFLGYLE
jgi:outer membrane protein TolC